MGAEGDAKGWLGWATDKATRALTSAKKSANPLPYALDQNNALFASKVHQQIAPTSIAQFISNTQLQDDVNSCITREFRASSCIIRAILDKNTPQVITLCRSNQGNINPVVFQLAKKYLEEQKEDILSTLGTTMPTPAEDPLTLIHADDMALIESTYRTSLSVLLAIQKNDVKTLTNCLENHKSLLPQTMIDAATKHLTQVGTTISTVIPLTAAPEEPIKNEPLAAIAPAEVVAISQVITDVSQPPIAAISSAPANTHPLQNATVLQATESSSENTMKPATKRTGKTQSK